MITLLMMVSVSAFAGEGNEASKEDVESVRGAILDYVEGVYELAPERIARSVHPDMRKHGFGWDGKKYREYPMTFEQLKDLAANYNKNGRIPKDAPKEITIFEVKDKTASAKLVAEWGQDYFHLAKIDGKWMITNVIWQSLSR
jgi:hypothetical protein